MKASNLHIIKTIDFIAIVSGCAIFLMLLLFTFSSCDTDTNKPTNNSTTQSDKPAALFTVLDQKETGLLFTNTLEETTYKNGLFYEYFYNGAGVATGDFNNDNLMDIYFVGNLVSNKLFLNKGDLQFEDISKQAQAEGKFGFATGVSVVDINNDGLLDIYICKSGNMRNLNHRRNELLLNKGPNSEGIIQFEEAAKKYGLDLPDYSTQATFFDYDRDGDLDLFLINHGIKIYDERRIKELMQTRSEFMGEKLFRNDGGTFIEVTDEAGIINNQIGFGLGVAIGDVNNDTWPDIYVSHDFSEKDHLYLNNKNGTFNEASLDAFQHQSNFSMGNDIGDINNDGLLDIIALDMMAEDNYTQKASMSGMDPARFNRHVDLGLHHQYMYNTLQLNSGAQLTNGTPLFSDIAQIAGVASTDWSWAPLVFDMNNDGQKDLFVSNGIKRDFRNNDFKIYHKKRQQEIQKDKSIPANTYINDLLSKMPDRSNENYFFVNNGDLTFSKQDFKQSSSNSNGAAYADFDNDGDLDVIVNNVDAYPTLYKNNSNGTGNYLNITLNGTTNNPNGIGARITLKSKGELQIQENYFSRGYQSAMANPIHFGLHKATTIDTLEILWANGKKQWLTDITVNQNITVQYKGQNDISTPKNSAKLFKNITASAAIDHVHKENEHNDFETESLMPHKMSQLGPCIAVGDINNDGLEDFFIGGAKGQSAAIYTQNNAQKFTKKVMPSIQNDAHHEDTGALFFDADNDGDLDLYVVSGGNEEAPNASYYEDRFYENNGQGKFIKNKHAIPSITSSGKVIKAADYDLDGDLDLFVGSRLQPMHYGQSSKSYILKNESTTNAISFSDVTELIAPKFLEHTMVTDALWEDLNNDSKKDLIIANEWGPIEIFINTNNGFINKTAAYGLADQIGWWFSLAVHDIDADGDLDIVAGNLGKNYKYQASTDKPFHMYLNDFDQNQSDDIVLGYHQNNSVYPLRGRSCSSAQMPFIKEKFKTYDAFAKSDLNAIYGTALEESTHYAATEFSSVILIKSNNKFEVVPLSNEVQISSVNKILIDDINKDNTKDLVLLGNLYTSEVETPRNDASYGHFLKGQPNGGYEIVPSNTSGLQIKGDVKDAAFIRLGKSTNEKGILIAKNNDALTLIKF